MSVNTTDLSKARAQLQARARGIWDQKNPSYSLGEQGGNALANITLLATLLDRKEEDVVLVYLLKHVLSVVSAVQRGDSGGEAAGERLADILNYLVMLEALL